MSDTTQERRERVIEVTRWAAIGAWWLVFGSFINNITAQFLDVEGNSCGLIEYNPNCTPVIEQRGSRVPTWIFVVGMVALAAAAVTIAILRRLERLDGQPPQWATRDEFGSFTNTSEDENKDEADADEDSFADASPDPGLVEKVPHGTPSRLENETPPGSPAIRPARAETATQAQPTGWRDPLVRSEIYGVSGLIIGIIGILQSTVR